MSVRAIVSIGTNSTRLLIVDGDTAQSLVPRLHRSTGTRLGTGLAQSGRLDSEAKLRTLATVDEYMMLVKASAPTATLFAIATSAMRRASDGVAFAREIEQRVGATLEILGGEREAALSFKGATAQYRSRGMRIGVLDVGGGSADYACGTTDVEFARSCEIGAVRLAEALPPLLGERVPTDVERLEADARAYARERLAPLAQAPLAMTTIAVGGTAFNAAALVTPGGRDDIDGARLARGDLTQLARRLMRLSVTQRRELPGISAQRADIFPAGLLILDEALGLLQAGGCIVSRADLLLGFLLEQIERGDAI